MPDFWQRLKQRKLVQWMLAYLAGAWVLLQVLDLVGERFDWPNGVLRACILAAGVGLFVALLLAWYHGERGAQKVGSTELLILALLLTIGGGMLWRFSPSPRPDAAADVGPDVPAASAGPSSAPWPADIPAKSIAVLPFENLSDDKSNAYFADGMQGLILTRLADIGDLNVISRTSTQKYASRPDDLGSIARQLGVATILEGSVQKAGNDVLVSVQLIDASNNAHLWADSYQRTLDNIFGVESEVAERIADALKAKLSPIESARLAETPTQNPEAYDLFLRAEYLAERGLLNVDGAKLKQAIALYGRAAEKDPQFAWALARKSFVESLFGWLGGGDADVGQLEAAARKDAERAVALSPRSVAAQVAVAYSRYLGRGDYQGAAAALTAALALKPNDTAALTAQGLILRRTGDIDGALASFRRALLHDPRNTSVIGALAETLMMTEDYDGARDLLRRAQAMDPDDIDAQVRDAYAMVLSGGDMATALRGLEGDVPRLQMTRVVFLTWQRRYDKALSQLQGLPDRMASLINYDKPLILANLYRLQGDADSARPLFEQALRTAQVQSQSQPEDISPIRSAYVWRRIADTQIGLGHTRAGLAAIDKALARVTQSGDHLDGPRLQYLCAGLYAEAGRANLALPVLDKALATPGSRLNISPHLLRIDPAWDPIRDDPGFQALLDKYPDLSLKSGEVVASTMVAGHG